MAVTGKLIEHALKKVINTHKTMVENVVKEICTVRSIKPQQMMMTHNGTMTILHYDRPVDVGKPQREYLLAITAPQILPDPEIPDRFTLVWGVQALDGVEVDRTKTTDEMEDEIFKALEGDLPEENRIVAPPHIQH